MHRINSPQDVAATGTVEVDAGAGIVMSVPVTHTEGSGGGSGITEAEVDAKILAAQNYSGSMANPVDLGTAHLDTVTAPNHYTQRFTGRATKVNGYPFAGAAGVLEVLAWHPTGIIQRWTSQEGGVATRYMLSGSWQTWKNALGATIT